MDYLNESFLWNELKNVVFFSENRTQFYTAEIILALLYLQRKGISHV